MYKQKIKILLIILGCFLFIFNVFNLNLTLGQSANDIDFVFNQQTLVDFSNDIWDDDTFFYNCEVEGNEILTRGYEFAMNNNTDELYSLDTLNADNWTDIFEKQNFNFLDYDGDDRVYTTQPGYYYYADIQKELINSDYESSSSEYFYGVYSFSNDDDGDNPLNWDTFESGGNVQIISDIGGHSKIIEMEDDNSGDLVKCNNDFINRTFGTIELWVRVSDVSKTSYISILGGGTQAVVLYFSGGNLGYYDGSSHIIVSVSSNTWYHIRIDFECGSGGYEGLSADYFYIYLNGNQYGQYPFYNSRDVLDELIFNTGTGDANYYIYIDSVGYSWNDRYEIGYNIYEGFELYGFTKNLYQLYYNESESNNYELIFHCEIETYQDFVSSYPTLYIKLTNDDNELLFEYRIKVNDNDNDVFTLYYYHQLGFELPVYNFSLRDEIEFRITPDDDYSYTIDIYNNEILDYSNENTLTYDNNLLNNVGNLTYYILENNTMSGTNEFHCDYIYIKSNGVYLHDNRISFIMWNYLDVDLETGYYSDSKYLSNELFFAHDIIGCYSFWYAPYDWFSDYPDVNDGWGYCLQKWSNYTENEFKFRNMLALGQYPVNYLAEGYHFFIKFFQDLEISTLKVFHSVFLDSDNLDSKMLAMNNWDVSYGYDENEYDTTVDFNNTIIYTIDNTFAYPDLSEKYSIYSEWYYKSYFYVLDDIFFVEYNVVNNSLEYIDIGFEFLPIDYFYTTNYSLVYEYYKRGSMTGYNIVSYITKYSTYTLNNYYYYHQELQFFSQNEYMDSLGFLLTDRDNDVLTNTTTNIFSIKDISFVITEGIAISILTGTLIDMFIPIFVILTPSLAISLKTDKKLFVPLFMIFTIVCAILEIIPLWIFFTIFLSLSTYLFLNRDDEQNDF